ncbi:glutamate 5-kinase [Raphidocelis subcapitata]|uniref:Glutamate 5-kinase n=1 Tax=Raphidocelis subcapitata TaxID=307507 RepID=A0A2V0PI91_9CHLO|nr:glutamate 5-kinase [Raphidocelis subcapitata]|eukprot:GBF97007.1 glutamate 5-kinase [Raphidocelis subcapitata]
MQGVHDDGRPVGRTESKSCVKAALHSDKKIIVIKIGTSSLIHSEYHSLHLANLARLCEVIKQLHVMGHYVILVSSGAIGVGCQRLGLSVKPTRIAQKQALAAVGQVHLMRYYEDFFQALGLTCAQVLLTLDNLADRSQYVNARNTFTELLAYGTIPVVNENDTVAVQELRFGDNDTLSALVATLVDADYLFLTTDVDALYTANPKLDPTARPIHVVEDVTRLTADTSSSGTQWGTGGMVTKLTAARIATAAGTTMVICSSAHPEVGGGWFGVGWRGFPVHGALWLDDGAVRAVRDKRKSLFSAGILRVVGEFSAQDAVSLCDKGGHEFGRALANYSAEEVRRVRGKSSACFAAELGYRGSEEVAFRGNTALLDAAHAAAAGALSPRAGTEEDEEDDDDWGGDGMRLTLAHSLDEALKGGLRLAAEAAEARAGAGSGGSGGP